MLAVAAVLFVVLGGLLHAHALFRHLRQPHPPFSETPDIYWNTAYYTPAGQRLLRIVMWVLYPGAVVLIALQLALRLSQA